MFGSVGWTCPNCKAIISPYETTCKACVPVKSYTGAWQLGGVTYSGLGTITLGGYNPQFFASGTVYAAPPKSDAQKLTEAKADADDWRDKFERLLEAVQEVIEEHQDDDDDD